MCAKNAMTAMRILPLVKSTAMRETQLKSSAKINKRHWFLHNL